MTNAINTAIATAKVELVAHTATPVLINITGLARMDVNVRTKSLISFYIIIDDVDYSLPAL